MITGFAILGMLTTGLLLIAAVCCVVVFLSNLLTHERRITILERQLDRLNVQVQNHEIDHIQSNIKGKKK